MSDSDTLKREAAERAVTYIQSGMVVGLGTGSTAVFAVRRIGALLAAGELQGIVGIPTAEVTAREAERCGVPLGSLDDYPAVDITIDGADEIDPRLNLIKGLGGALLREPEDIRTKSGDVYKVFTPFWRALRQGLAVPAPKPAPRNIPAPSRIPKGLPLKALDLLPVQPDWAGGMRNTWTPGEAGAHARLAGRAHGAAPQPARRRSGSSGFSRNSLLDEG